MARIAGVDLPREKRIEIGLTYIYGIGRPSADKILAKAEVNPDTRVRDLTDDEVKRLSAVIDETMTVEGDLRREIALNIKDFQSRRWRKQYMARIAGVDLPREKRIEIGLTYIYGIGRPSADKILAKAEVNPDTRVRDLTDDEVKRLSAVIDETMTVEGDLRREIALNIKRLQ